MQTSSEFFKLEVFVKSINNNIKNNKKNITGIGKKINGANKYISVFWGLKSKVFIWVDAINPITAMRIAIGHFTLVFGANKNRNSKNNGNNAYKHVIGKKQEIIFKYSRKKLFIFTILLLIIKSTIFEIAAIVGIIKMIKPNIAK